MDYEIPQVSGGFDLTETLRPVTDFIAVHAMAVFVTLVVLAIVVIYLAFNLSKQSFNPTQNMRFSDSDQYSLGRKEGLDSGPKRDQSYFARDKQESGGLVTSATAAQVLSSSDFDCANRKALTSSDSWAWLNSKAHEAGENFKPDTDNGLSMKLAGL